MKKYSIRLIVFFAVVLITASMSVTVHAADFDGETPRTDDSVFLHCDRSKIPENTKVFSYRTVRDIFDADYYLLNFPEVWELIDSDISDYPEGCEKFNLSDEEIEILYKYFMKEGWMLRHVCSPYLDIVWYMAHYPEIRNQLGFVLDRYVEHYFATGYTQGNYCCKPALVEEYPEKAGENEDYTWLDEYIEKLALKESTIEKILDNPGVYVDEKGDIWVDWPIVERRVITMDELARLCGDDLLIYTDSEGNILFIGGNCARYGVYNDKDALSAIHDLSEILKIPENLVAFELVDIETGTTGDKYYRFGARRADDSKVAYRNYYIIMGTTADGTVFCVNTESQTKWYDLPQRTPDSEIAAAIEAQKGKGFNLLPWEPKVYYDSYIGAYVITYYFTYPGDNYYIYELRNYLTDNIGWYMAVYEKELYDENGYRDIATTYRFKSTFDREAEKRANGTAQYLDFMDYFGNKVSLQVMQVGVDTNGTPLYCLIDPDRHIIAMNEKSDGPYLFYSPADFTGKEYYISAFVTVQKTYDNYKALGMYDNPNNNKPFYIYFLDNETAENAYCSPRFDYIEVGVNNHKVAASFDVLAHELGHAAQGLLIDAYDYSNTSGAIMESLADIMGNLMEMMYSQNGGNIGNVDFNEFLLAETTRNPALGEALAMRSMGNPNNFGQPGTVGDSFYFIPNRYYKNTDNGGVHTNSGILNNILYRMYKEAGMPMDVLLPLWYESMMLFNNSTDYGSFEYILMVLMKHQGLDSYIPAVRGIFSDANLGQAGVTAWSKLNVKDGVTKVYIDDLGLRSDGFLFYNPDLDAYFSVDEEGVVAGILPNGTQINRIIYKDNSMSTYVQGYVNNPIALEGGEVKLTFDKDSFLTSVLSINVNKYPDTFYWDERGSDIILNTGYGFLYFYLVPQAPIDIIQIQAIKDSSGYEDTDIIFEDFVSNSAVRDKDGNYSGVNDPIIVVEKGTNYYFNVAVKSENNVYSSIRWIIPIKEEDTVVVLGFDSAAGKENAISVKGYTDGTHEEMKEFIKPGTASTGLEDEDLDANTNEDDKAAITKNLADEPLEERLIDEVETKEITEEPERVESAIEESDPAEPVTAESDIEEYSIEESLPEAA